MFWNKNSKSSTSTDKIKKIIKKDMSFQYEKKGICISWEIYGLQYGTLNGEETVLDKDIINSLCSDITDSFCRNNSKYFPKPSNVYIQVNPKSIHSYDNTNKEVSSTNSNNEESQVSSLFSVITPIVNVEDVYLDDATKNTIKDALAILKYRDILFKKWKLGGTNSSRSLVLNFYGPSGTGKTMMAEAIGNYLQKKVLFVDYSQLESRYVGDTPKNIKQAFNEARAQDAILVFDEADSFLGKRIENVSQGAEQALNSLRSQMLILLEDFEGVVLFATNLVTNFDKAFNSRILANIKLDLPNKEARAEIIKVSLPPFLPIEKPFTDEEILEISEIIDGFSGREIKNAILSMLLKKAGEYGKDAIFVIDDLKVAMTAKKEEMERLKAEENERLKLKISTKLKEKAMEESEMSKQKGNQRPRKRNKK